MTDDLAHTELHNSPNSEEIESLNDVRVIKIYFVRSDEYDSVLYDTGLALTLLARRMKSTLTPFVRYDEYDSVRNEKHNEK